ncbi:MAG: peptidylprolyl isomerase, partial [Bryobacteraceae bacterium]
SIVIKLHEKESPITVKNFTDLARGLKEWPDPKTGQRVKRPLYNGLTFHRVIPSFMIQGGDPLGNGTGGTDMIKDEFHPSLKFDGPGKLAMANAGLGTGSSQFFITERESIAHLDGKHTIFGQVIEGQDVVNNIARVPRDANDKPRTPVRIVRVLIQREPSAAKPPAVRVTTTKKTVPATKSETTAPKSSAPATTKKK